MIAINVTDVKPGEWFSFYGRSYVRCTEDEVPAHINSSDAEAGRIVAAYTTPDRNGNRVPAAFNTTNLVFVNRK
jgi:hypothetical protein